MENGAISDRQIGASSQLSANHTASQGRLYFKANASKAGAWSPALNDGNQWLQVDLGSRYTKVTGVATQGRDDYSQWVTKYQLQYSDVVANFQYYREHEQMQSKVKFTFSSNKGAQWWERSPPNNVARVRFADSSSYVG